MKELQKVLASLAVLNQKVYNMHWNVKGVGFMAVHKITEELFEIITEQYDEIAEKIVMQGDVAVGTLKEYLELSVIDEVKGKKFTVSEVTTMIADDLSKLGDLVSSIEGNKYVQPVLDELLLQVDKYKWFFNSSK